MAHSQTQSKGQGLVSKCLNYPFARFLFLSFSFYLFIYENPIGSVSVLSHFFISWISFFFIFYYMVYFDSLTDLLGSSMRSKILFMFRGFLVWEKKKKVYFVFIFLVFYWTTIKNLIWFNHLYSVFIFNIKKIDLNKKMNTLFNYFYFQWKQIHSLYYWKQLETSNWSVPLKLDLHLIRINENQ